MDIEANTTSEQDAYKTPNSYEKLLALYNTINVHFPVTTGASIVGTTTNKEDSKIVTSKLVFSKINLQKFESRPHSHLYTTNLATGETTRLTSMPSDEGQSEDVICKSEHEGSKVIIRKEGKEGKKIYLEHWNEDGFQKSLKIKGCGNIYNDEVFGGISWSQDGTKITFIAEKEEVAEYRAYWDPENKDESKEKEEKDKKPDFYNKYLYNEKDSSVKSHFGETLESKHHSVIVVYDLVKKTVQVMDIQRFKADGQIDDEDIFKDVFPAFPVFDKSGSGIVFMGFHLPIEKLGLIYCFNRPTKLYYITNYEDKTKLDKKEDSKEESKEEKPKHKYNVRTLTEDYYYAGFPKFTSDYAHLSFFGSKDLFHTHMTSLALYTIKNLGEENEELYTVIEREHGEDGTFSGLYGYHGDYRDCQFIKGTHTMMITTCNKGKGIVCTIDVDTKAYKLLECPDDSARGDLKILTIKDEFAYLLADSVNNTGVAYLVDKSHTDSPIWHKIDQIKVQSKPTRYCDFLSDVMEKTKIDTFSIGEGTEGYFIRVVDSEHKLFEADKRPCILILHGGPHTMAKQNTYLKQRLHWLAMGYQLCVVNYRGSLGYGINNVNVLSGKIFEYDVNDCLNLFQTCIDTFKDEIDDSKLGVYGGSHGGFLSCSIISHPDWCERFSAACIWNPVTSIHAMVTATDIPDWTYSCTLNSENKWVPTKEETIEMYNRSPISRVSNVKTPSLFVIGGSDSRCPPFNGMQFWKCVKSLGVDTEMHYYPGQGHSVSALEQGLDANMNLTRWWLKYLG